VLPEGRDPADLAREVGADGVRAAVDAATPVVPFVVRHRLADADLTTEAGRTAALRDALEVVGREPDLDLRREWARTEVAARVGVAYEFVVRTAQRLGVELDAHEGVAPVGARRGPAADRGGVASLDRARVRREREVLRTAIQQPQWLPDEWYELRSEDFTHPLARQLFDTIAAAGGAGVELAAVLDVAADDEVRGKLRELALEEEPVPVDAEMAAWRVRSLLADRLQTEARALESRLQTLHHTRDQDELRSVLSALRELEARRRSLLHVTDT
jgi:DNA primase